MSRSATSEFWTDEASGASAASYWVYCIAEDGAEDAGPCKVGVATRLETRLSSLQGGNWRVLRLMWKIRLSDRKRALDTEQRLLIQFRPDPYFYQDPTPRLRSEWVSASPYTVLEQAVHFINAAYESIRRVA